MLKGLNINPTLLKLPQMKDKKGSQRDTTHLFHPIPIVIDTPASSPPPPTINEAPQSLPKYVSGFRHLQEVTKRATNDIIFEELSVV